MRSTGTPPQILDALVPGALKYSVEVGNYLLSLGRNEINKQRLNVRDKTKEKINMIDNALIRQVLSLPELIEQQYNDLEPKARKALPHRRSSVSSVSSLLVAAIPIKDTGNKHAF